MFRLPRTNYSRDYFILNRSTAKKGVAKKLPPIDLALPCLPYVVVACTKCGKLTYALATQKARQCPVCRLRILVARTPPLASFARPAEATRYIAAEEVKKTNRLDFVPVAGFAPASVKRIARPRTEKFCGALPTSFEIFAAWVRQYFAQLGDLPVTGIPVVQVTAAATQVGFANVGSLVDQAVKNHVLERPRPYTLAMNGNRRYSCILFI